MTHKDAQGIFKYARGKLYWRHSRGSRAVAGGEAGTHLRGGYRSVSIGGKRYLVHRIIFLYHFGYMPEHGVDHIDRNPKNNQINNLREVSQSCNMRNSRTRKDNSSTVRGVYWCTQVHKWYARITVGGRTISLGFHECLIECAALRLAAEQCFGWSYCDRESSASKHIKNYICKNVTQATKIY